MTITDRFLESALLLGFVEDHDYHREAAPMHSTGRLVLDEWFPEDDVRSWFVEYKCEVCGDRCYVYSPDTHERVYEVLVQAGVIERSDFGAKYALVPDFPSSRRVESSLLLDHTLAHGQLHEGISLRSTGVMVAVAGLPEYESTSWRMEYWCEVCRVGVYAWDLYANNISIDHLLRFRGIWKRPF